MFGRVGKVELIAKKRVIPGEDTNGNGKKRGNQIDGSVEEEREKGR